MLDKRIKDQADPRIKDYNKSQTPSLWFLISTLLSFVSPFSHNDGRRNELSSLSIHSRTWSCPYFVFEVPSSSQVYYSWLRLNETKVKIFCQITSLFKTLNEFQCINHLRNRKFRCRRTEILETSQTEQNRERYIRS